MARHHKHRRHGHHKHITLRHHRAHTKMMTKSKAKVCAN